MREIRTSGSVGAAGGNSRGDPTVRGRSLRRGWRRLLGRGGRWFGVHLAGAIDGAQDHVCLVGGKHELQLHHPARQEPLAYGALLGCRRLARGLGGPVAAAQAFELRPGRLQRHLQQTRFVLRRGHAGEGADLGVRKPGLAQRLVDRGQTHPEHVPPAPSRARWPCPAPFARPASARRRWRPGRASRLPSSNCLMHSSSRCVAASRCAARLAISSPSSSTFVIADTIHLLGCICKRKFAPPTAQSPA